MLHRFSDWVTDPYGSEWRIWLAAGVSTAAIVLIGTALLYVLSTLVWVLSCD